MPICKQMADHLINIGGCWLLANIWVDYAKKKTPSVSKHEQKKSVNWLNHMPIKKKQLKCCCWKGGFSGGLYQVLWSHNKTKHRPIAKNAVHNKVRISMHARWPHTISWLFWLEQMIQIWFLSYQYYATTVGLVHLRRRGCISSHLIHQFPSMLVYIICIIFH